MNRKQKKERKRLQCTRQLMGIDQFTSDGLKAGRRELVYFLIRPDNLSVLSPEGIRARIMALTNLLRGVDSVCMMALDSRESFQSNKDWYRRRMEQEDLPALRELLRQDAAHLDSIQADTASAREFALVFTLDRQKEENARTQVSRLEKPAGSGLPRPQGRRAGPHAPVGGLLPERRHDRGLRQYRR